MEEQIARMLFKIFQLIIQILADGVSKKPRKANGRPSFPSRPFPLPVLNFDGRKRKFCKFLFIVFLLGIG